jgi:hypothetical protein
MKLYLIYIFAGRQKLNIRPETEIKLVLNSDGVEVEADYFDSLEPNTTLMVLCGEERWTAQFTGRYLENLFGA